MSCIKQLNNREIRQFIKRLLGIESFNSLLYRFLVRRVSGEDDREQKMSCLVNLSVRNED